MGTQLEELIERVIKKHAANIQIKEVVTGVAKNITETACDIERAANPMIHRARLNAIDDTLESYVTVYPKDGSNVIAGIIEGMKTEAVILRCSEVERVKIKIGEQTFLMDKDGFVFIGGK